MVTRGRLLGNVLLSWVVLWGIVCSSNAVAAERVIASALQEIAQSQAFEVPLYKSRILTVDTPVRKLSVGNPQIADILILRSNQVYVVGKALGTTNVVLWDRSNSVIATIDIEITHDTDTLKAKLYELLPGESIRVYSSQGAIVLSGEVSSPAAIDAAMAVATSFAPEDEEGNVKEGKVVNLMHVGGVQQVMLAVKVAEMSRTVFRQFDINWQAIGQGLGNWTVGAFSTGSTDPLIGGIDKGFFGQFLTNEWRFDFLLNAAKNNGLAKILAEPNLTTLTGQEATFLAGGQFPIPVPSGLGAVGIEFKDFGIALGFLPVVLDSDRINLDINVSVSDLTGTAPVVVSGGGGGVTPGASSDFFVPSLRVRSATSTLELGDGQTMAIAGLISDQTREDYQKFPGLGDLPVLGQLWKSEEFQNDQTELVIFVTPTLAKPTPRNLVRLPTESFVEPNDVEFYLLGRMEHRGHPAEDTSATTNPENDYYNIREPAETQGQGGLEGSFGHQL